MARYSPDHNWCQVFGNKLMFYTWKGNGGGPVTVYHTTIESSLKNSFQPQIISQTSTDYDLQDIDMIFERQQESLGHYCRRRPRPPPCD